MYLRVFAVHKIKYKYKNKKCVRATVASRSAHKKKYHHMGPGKNYPVGKKRILATCLRAYEHVRVRRSFSRPVGPDRSTTSTTTRGCARHGYSRIYNSNTFYK